ncbi:MAG: glycoside hydrolase, family 43 [Acidimicrobiales bacterium]|nr:glycoside hydrolase, family 43 [Acidimicrobiales bacterium]
MRTMGEAGPGAEDDDAPADVTAVPARHDPPSAGAPGVDRPRRRRRRLRIATLATIGVAVLAVLVSQGLFIRGLQHDLFRSRTSDLDARTQLLASRARLQRDVGVLIGQLDGMTTAYRNQTAARNNLRTQLTATIQTLRDTTAKLGKTAGKLNTTQKDLDAQVAQLRLTKECLQGVQQALERVSVADYAGAALVVQGVKGQCQAALDQSLQAVGYPAYDGSAADPFVLRAGSTYFGYATNSIGGSVQLLSGSRPTELVLRGPALANLASWATVGGTWGPSVLQRGNRWVLYYTARIRGSDKSCISRAVGVSPAGPFLDDTVLPIVCQLDRGGSIDPSATVGSDGSAWLVWKSEGVRGLDPSRIWSQKLSADGLGVEGPAVGLLAAHLPWQQGVIEGPALVQHGGRWLLFYSANDWNTTAYAIGFAACQAPQGPCTELQDGPIFQPQSPLVGAGGQELFTGPDGRAWMAFHAWVEGQVGYPNLRRLYVATVDLDARIPRIVQQRVA